MEAGGEAASILGDKNLGEATGALIPEVGVLGLRGGLLDLGAAGFKARDKPGGFEAGERERVTPGGNFRLISSRFCMIPLPALFVIQLFVFVFKSFTIFILDVKSFTILVFTRSLIIASFLALLSVPLLEINCLPPANFVCSFKLDTTVDPLF